MTTQQAPLDQPTLARTAVALLQGYPCDIVGFAISGRLWRHEDRSDLLARPTDQHLDVTDKVMEDLVVRGLVIGES